MKDKILVDFTPVSGLDLDLLLLQSQLEALQRCLEAGAYEDAYNLLPELFDSLEGLRRLSQ